jgi:hypothetical protein
MSAPSRGCTSDRGTWLSGPSSTMLSVPPLHQVSHHLHVLSHPRTNTSIGVAIAAVVIFFSTGIIPKGVEWWADEAYAVGCDVAACVRLHLKNGTYFGPQ